MRVCVTEHRAPPATDPRPAGELAPSLALPWIAKLREGMLAGQVALVLAANFLFHIALPLGWIAIPLSLTAVSNILGGWRKGVRYPFLCSGEAGGLRHG